MKEDRIVYVVTCGSYSDYHILAIFTDREDAEEHANNIYCRVEVYRLNHIINGNCFFYVVMKRDGEVINCVDQTYDGYGYEADIAVESGHYGEPLLCASVWADDETHAIKIVNEHRSALIAANRFKVGTRAINGDEPMIGGSDEDA